MVILEKASITSRPERGKETFKQEVATGWATSQPGKGDVNWGTRRQALGPESGFHPGSTTHHVCNCKQVM